MKILAVDTALGACSAAVLDSETTLAHRLEAMDRGHAEALAPMVEATMREAGIAFSALERLAVTTGPGTFTGQRVGLAFMRGLRIALKRPLIGITTLNAMCAAAMAETDCRYAAAIHDARRSEAYLAIVAGDETLLIPTLVSLDDAATIIATNLSAGQIIALAGTAAERMEKDLAAKGFATRFSSIRQPDALWVARLGLKAATPKDAPVPLYLRAPDAKLPMAKA
jgi:tRNA threonylcarbamoyladenosine biosynthesis protein TsaB